MNLKDIKALNENPTICFGANRIKMTSFQPGFINLANKGTFFEFSKTGNRNQM